MPPGWNDGLFGGRKTKYWARGYAATTSPHTLPMLSMFTLIIVVNWKPDNQMTNAAVGCEYHHIWYVIIHAYILFDRDKNCLSANSHAFFLIFQHKKLWCAALSFRITSIHRIRCSSDAITCMSLSLPLSLSISLSSSMWGNDAVIHSRVIANICYVITKIKMSSWQRNRLWLLWLNRNISGNFRDQQ